MLPDKLGIFDMAGVHKALKVTAYPLRGQAAA